MAKTCKIWVMKQLKTDITGEELEVATKGREKSDWLFAKDGNAIIIEDKEIKDTTFKKAVIQVHRYGEEVYTKYKNIITIAVKELQNHDHEVGVFINGLKIEKHPRNKLNSLDYYWSLLEKPFDKNILSKNIAKLNNEMHALGIADNVRASIAATLLVCINKHLELTDSDDLETIITKVYKHLYMYTKDENGEDLNKWKKIKTLYDRFCLDIKQQEAYLNSKALYKVWQEIKFNIFEYIKNTKTSSSYDVMSLFFTTFSKAALSNDKGQYFTPDHISSLMIDSIGINVNSKVLDPTCGSGTFLAKCMDKMINLANFDENKIIEIKQKQIFGIEKDPLVYGLATANMLLHKDGKSNIENGDCFRLLDSMKKYGINRVVMNPPYKEKVTDIEELKFLYETLEIMVPEGLAAIILPTSCATGAKYSDYRYSLMQKHTLLACMTCPPELFYPTSANTCIMIWKAHVPHSGITYLGNWKEDGYRKKRLGKKNTVRICDQEKWETLKQKWLNDLTLADPKFGLKIELNDKMSWLYESHYKIDFTKEIKEQDFMDSINDYLAFLIREKGMIE